jgi:hypothetical protein
MTVYVRTTRAKDQDEYIKLAKLLSEKEFDDSVEYNAGGWSDMQLRTVAPHLKFYVESDAIVYVLTVGGKVSKTIPLMEE